MQFNIGWFANPIFGDGDYPSVMWERLISNTSSGTRLPSFTQNDKDVIKGTDIEFSKFSLQSYFLLFTYL